MKIKLILSTMKKTYLYIYSAMVANAFCLDQAYGYTMQQLPSTQQYVVVGTVLSADGSTEYLLREL
ncbi:MAG: hypothetical protein Q8K36_01635, partial [Alphaproteobacteria bacterium]|nr:hypothetical protein [Alphaproteobacteria bacterium]